VQKSATLQCRLGHEMHMREARGRLGRDLACLILGAIKEHGCILTVSGGEGLN
jgi:hypothetical protein